MKLIRIPDTALDNPDLTRNHWIRIECYSMRVLFRLGKYMLVHRIHYLQHGG